MANEESDTSLQTISGVKKAEGWITVKLKIFEIEKEMNIFVVNDKNFKYDLLLGLDCIKQFKLIQDEDLKIKQSSLNTEKNKNQENTSKEIFQENNNEKYIINFNEHIDEKNFEIQINHLLYEEKIEINQLIERYKSVFAKDKFDIGTVRNYEAHIDLVIEKYPSKRPYRCTMTDKREIEEQVSKLLEKNLIEESYSPFAAPVTLAYKRDEGTKSRLCIDFRDLNEIVIPESQPFPLIEDIMEKARNCRYFTKLDINSAFWSIPLRITDRQKTAFVTQEGHFQWTCLPFGLKTAPAIFQRILSNIIRKNRLTGFTVNYIDDILVFSKTFHEHLEHVSQLLEAVLREGFRLKFSKCAFAESSVKYLGHIIENNNITPINDNLVAIKAFPTPKTRKNVRQFLGKINFYHKYIKDSTIILEPLHNLLRKDQKFIWTEKCQESFNKTKNFLCSKPVLGIFDPDKEIYIYTDASIQGLGAILKQPQENGDEKPIAYFSKRLTKSQTQKKAIYLECLAIKEAIQYWQYRLMGKRFTIFTDHKPLLKLNIKSRTDEELGNMTFLLSQYNFDIKYNPGKYNTEADCLSRNPVLDPSEDEEKNLKIVNLVTLEEILEDQSKNLNLDEKKKKLILEDEIYYKSVKKRNKILLSESMGIALINKIHNYYCHIGREQVKSKLSPYFTFKNITAHIREICKKCTTCIKNKTRGQGKFGLMSHLGPAKRPFEIVSIDTIGGFGGSRSTKKYLHLLTDHFTRYAYILTSQTQSAKDFTKLVENVIKSYKIDIILADQYPGINSSEFKEFLKTKNINIIFTSVDTPFSNGLNERLNQTLVNKIRCKYNEKETKTAWTTIAHECTKLYNETVHSVTKFTPKYLLEGEDVSILPQELKKEHRDLNNDREIAFKNSQASHIYNKKLFDKGRIEYEFKIGQEVYVENGNKLNRKKLGEIRSGPFEILEKISQCIFKVSAGYRKAESNLFHVSKLLPAPQEENL